MSRLTLLRAAARTVRGRKAPTLPSRFLEGLEGSLLEARDETRPAAPGRVREGLERMRAILGR
jgi:hypothetical protein